MLKPGVFVRVKPLARAGCSLGTWRSGFLGLAHKIFGDFSSSSAHIRAMFTPLNDPQMSAHSLQSHSPREDGSPDDASTNDRKRRRKVLSCFTCRRRKLRCDREYPFCARCQNSGCANSCTYDTPPDPGSATYDRPYPRGGTQINLARATAAMGPRQADSLHTSTSSMLPGIAQAASQRRPQQFEGRLPAREVGSLQVRLARLERAAGTAANDSEPLEEEQPARGTSLFKGKGFKTQFYGATCPMSIVAQVSEHLRQPRQID